MKILVVGRWMPWPVSTGGRHRLANIVRALGRLGEVDFYGFTTEDGAANVVPPAGSGVVRARVVPRPAPAGRIRRLLVWGPFGRLPSSLYGRDYRGMRADLIEWAAPRYDLVWFNKPETFVAFGSLFSGSVVVDIDDLYDQVALQRMSEDRPRNPTIFVRVASAFAQLLARKDARLWTQLHAHISKRVAAVVVCSELDRRRLGAPNGVVIPNGYDAPSTSVGRRETGDTPTIVFPGLLINPSNVDAAVRLATEIAPVIRKRIPNLSIRLVGDPSPAVRRLHDPPRVTVTGRVDDIVDELARADLIAVPLRYGSGTRIKILEAFAHGIPVVSSSLGAEGLEVVDGTHLLLGDSLEDFASACARVLLDETLRLELTFQARSLYEERFSWDRIDQRIADLVRAVASDAPVRV